jgi:hypothetical protein
VSRSEIGPPARRQRPVDTGQAVVETAIVLPLITLFLLLVVQMVLIGRDQVALWHVARVAVRSAAVSPQPEVTAQEVTTRLAPGAPIEVSTTVDVEWVEVRLERRISIRVLVIGALIGDRVLTAHATMRRE